MKFGTQNSRIYLKISQIAKMRVNGIKDVQIAAALNITNSGLQRILRLNEYKEIEEAELHGQLSKFDEAFAGKREFLEDQWRKAVPVAVRGILETAMQKRDLRSALAAQKEILDRDPDKIFNSAAGASSGTSTGPSLPKEILAEAVAEGNSVGAKITAAKPSEMIN